MNTSKKTTPAGDANPNARPVKDVIKPAKAVLGKASVSVQTALEEMQAQGIDSAPVTNQRGELLGTVSSNEMNRKVGGLGHDPKTEPVEGKWKKRMSIASKIRRLRRLSKSCATQRSLNFLW